MEVFGYYCEDMILKSTDQIDLKVLSQKTTNPIRLRNLWVFLRTPYWGLLFPLHISDFHEYIKTGMFLSMPFLLATFIVYALLPESRTLHEKALMSYVLTLLFAYSSLAISKLQTFIPTLPCYLLGVLGGMMDTLLSNLKIIPACRNMAESTFIIRKGCSTIFFFISSIAWLNVMCIDMWLAFRSFQGFNNRRTTQKKRYIHYNVYALGVPMLDVLIVLLVDTWGDDKSKIHPGISKYSCFLNGGLPSFLYFYLPITVIMIINCTLFIVTGIKIYKSKKEAEVLMLTDSQKHLSEDHNNEFKLYLKLYFAMGINWFAELIFYASGALCEKFPPALTYLFDFIDFANGLVIFFVFVFKWKIWRSLTQRYYFCIGKPGFPHDLPTIRKGRTGNVNMIQLEDADE